MNRQMKRQQERAERRGRTAAPDRQAAAQSARRAAGAVPGAPRKRTGARQFLKEVSLELKKVDWPTRRELGAYTAVVLVSVTVLTSFVFGLDFVFTQGVFKLFAKS